MPLTIVAHIRCHPAQESHVEAELRKLIEPTRKEAGCLQYDLHRDRSTDGHFLFFENWENRDLWQAHMSAPHLAAYMAATEGAVETFEVHEMEHLA